MSDYADLTLRVLPRSPQEGWGGRRGGAWVVRLTAAPVEGAANQALLRFLRKQLGVPAADLEIISGPRSRHKVVRVRGLSPAQLQSRLPAGLASAAGDSAPDL